MPIFASFKKTHRITENLFYSELGRSRRRFKNLTRNYLTNSYLRIREAAAAPTAGIIICLFFYAFNSGHSITQNVPILNRGGPGAGLKFDTESVEFN